MPYIFDNYENDDERIQILQDLYDKHLKQIVELEQEHEDIMIKKGYVYSDELDNEIEENEKLTKENEKLKKAIEEFCEVDFEKTKKIEELKEEIEELKENKSDLEYCLESLKKAISLGEKGWVKGGELYDLYVLPLKEENEKLKEELDVLSLA